VPEYEEIVKELLKTYLERNTLGSDITRDIALEDAQTIANMYKIILEAIKAIDRQ